MIVGLIPVGGKGTRLGLFFPKEMLPQIGFDYYNPLINLTVTNMLETGVEKIYFIHGHTFKTEIADYYNTPNMIHITQRTLGFANVLADFHNSCPMLKSKDNVLFGLPDSVYSGNPFLDMVKQEGISCGLFNSNPEIKVDRLSVDGSCFQVKTTRNDSNQEYFWGVLKFSGKDIHNIIDNGMLDRYTEIGDILNQYPRSYVYGGAYSDLGTWKSLNAYWSAGGSYD